ncbi:MAG: hypothetical protein ABI741_11915 [Ferruginibacter sp.]
MKTTKQAIITPIGENELKELLKETKETLATGISKNNASAATFTLLDLWRVQKKQKTLGSSTKW